MAALNFVGGIGAAQSAADQAAAAQSAANIPAFQNAVYGNSTGVSVAGSQDVQNGALSGLQMGNLLYGQNMSQTGQQAQQYNQMVSANLGRDSAQSDIARQAAQSQVALGNNKAGLSGTDTTGASEQAARGASMQAAGMNQQFQNQAVNTFGKMVGATQQGQASQLASGEAVGQASTPLAVPQQSSGCVIATHAVASGAFDKSDLYDAVKWCKESLHGKWWGESIRRGYRFLGKKKIANGTACNSYAEFKQFIEFGSGKKRNIRAMIAFACRSIQMFTIGLFLKE